MHTKNLLDRCKEELMWIATPEGVLRSLRSDLASKDAVEVNRLYKTYFDKPIHNGLREFIESSVREKDDGLKALVMTHANIHSDVSKCLDGFLQFQSERLSTFKSEKQLTRQIQNFWRNPTTQLLVIQCSAEVDADHMLLLKTTIENHHEEYVQSTASKSKRLVKHVCIIVHIERQKQR